MPVEGQPQKRARNEDWDEGASRTPRSRACTECKKHKIKCEKLPDQTQCFRCQKQGYQCTVAVQVHKANDDDLDWKKAASAQLSQLRNAVTDLLRIGSLPPLSDYGELPNKNLSPPAAMPFGPSPTEEPTAMTRVNSQDPDSDAELVSAPMGSLYEVTKLRNLRSHLQTYSPLRANMLEEDFISRGMLPIGEAENLFALFYKIMNQFLWGGIALKHPDLVSARRSSSLLTAAILSVASLHVPGNIEVFNICYAEFISLVSSSTLNRYHTLDEIRGLAIGAFWLSDLSWKLSGHAVRIATEMNLHQSLQRMLQGHPEEFEKARLWYLLYVCDHHFSIAYGRPPVIHDSSSITNYKAFVESPSAEPGDVRMCIQVALFLILTKAYHEFSSDAQNPLREEDFATLRAYNLEVDAWRLKSQPISPDSPYVGAYPSKGVVLYYHFARFQLNSLSLRAISPETPLSLERREAANNAIASAMAILNTILYEQDIRNAIVGIPLFTHTMVAFSSVFVIKVAWKWKAASLNIDQIQIWDLVQKVIDVLSSVAASEKHLAYHIASGLRKLLDEIKTFENGPDSHFGLQPLEFGHMQPSMMPSQSLVYDTFDTFGFDTNDTWNGYPGTLGIFGNSFPTMNQLRGSDDRAGYQ